MHLSVAVCGVGGLQCVCVWGGAEGGLRGGRGSSGIGPDFCQDREKGVDGSRFVSQSGGVGLCQT